MPASHALTSRGIELDTSAGTFGELRSSADIADDTTALQDRMEQEGYVYLPGFLNRDDIFTARQEVCRRLDASGDIDRRYPLIDAIAASESLSRFSETLGNDNPQLARVLYDGPMISLLERFLGDPVRHFDYTWFRAMAPGGSTPPHYDIVYMGRGTKRLYTAWTPIGDVSLEDGPLMVMEGSNHLERLKQRYGSRDVDTYCSNRPHLEGRRRTQLPTFGALTLDAARLRANLGLRWLTTEFKAGDLLFFTMFTLHASIDNQGPRIRLSSDSRYQRADEPVDDRWVSIDGRPPVKHGDEARREMIC